MREERVGGLVESNRQHTKQTPGYEQKRQQAKSATGQTGKIIYHQLY
jgi:hypothetical protein